MLEYFLNILQAHGVGLAYFLGSQKEKTSLNSR